MKKIFSILLFSIFLGSCIKVQKRSDLLTEDVVEQNQIQPQATRYYLDAVLDLKKDTDINADEVYLSKHARIYTNQYQLKINTRRLVSEYGATIQTVSIERSKANLESPGFDGGIVKIKTDVAEGHLNVNMNGQSGGDGRGGWTALASSSIQDLSFLSEPGRSACNPNGGADAGQSGSFYLEAEQSKDLFIVKSMATAEGGSIGPIATDRSIEYMPDYFTKYKVRAPNCYETPQVGQPGRPGAICIKYSAAEYPKCESY